MRRKDREVTDKAKLAEILESADVCRIALFAENAPYIIPLNYGYSWDDKLELFFHCAGEGRKLSLIGLNNSAGFEIDVGHELVTGDSACEWGMKFRSIIGTGKIFEVRDPEGKRRALDLIMRHYGFPGAPEYADAMLGRVTVLRLEVNEMTGKRKA